MSMGRKGYQSEGSQDGQALHIRQTQLHQAQADDDAVENVPALLKIKVRVQSDDLQNHLSSEDSSEDLQEQQIQTNGTTVRRGRQEREKGADTGPDLAVPVLHGESGH